MASTWITVVMSIPPPLRASGRQHLQPILGDEEGVLELCGAPAVARGRRPAVGPHPLSSRAQVQHGLHGEAMPRLHDAHGLVLLEVRDLSP